MKCHIPQISWHNRDPVLSVDFQKNQDGILRLATAGTDTHVLIWLLTHTDCNNINVEFVADLNRHTKAVNAVRFSPNGEILASADDDACIILWKQQTLNPDDIFADQDSINKEHWVQFKVLRGHINDVCDISWSSDGSQLMSGSVDNTAILWDTTKGKSTSVLSEHKGFVQGVSFDPKGQYLATICSDRKLRIYHSNSKKVAYNVHKAILPNAGKELPDGQTAKAGRIFYDDTLKSFCRRLSFSPDGELLIVPSGIVEEGDGKFSNATYVFTRQSLNKPVVYLPSGSKFTLAVRCCPVLFQLRNKINKPDGSEFQPLFSLPYRIIFAVATQDSIYLYDTQQTVPIGRVSNIHYTRLSDLSWSHDGRVLMASSTDGYCSFLVFEENELGLLYSTEKDQPNATSSATIIETKISALSKEVDKVKLTQETETENLTLELSKVESVTLEKHDIADGEQNTDSLDWKLVLEPSTALDEVDMKETNNIEQSMEISDLVTKQATNCMPTEVSESNVNPNEMTKVPNEDVKKPRRVPLITLASKKPR